MSAIGIGSYKSFLQGGSSFIKVFLSYPKIFRKLLASIYEPSLEFFGS